MTYTPPPNPPRPIEEFLRAPPQDYKLQTILPVGYPADPPKPKYERKGLEDVVSFNGF